jgi:hypothetical protein
VGTSKLYDLYLSIAALGLGDRSEFQRQIFPELESLVRCGYVQAAHAGAGPQAVISKGMEIGGDAFETAGFRISGAFIPAKAMPWPDPRPSSDECAICGLKR